MATVTSSTDTILNILFSTSDRVVGHNSIWASQAHPGTNSTIQGWQWDRRTWPSSREFEALENVPSLWDPTISGLDDDYWQSGYGDNYDLLLLGVEILAYSGIDIWAPKIHRGYYYSHDEEWYLYSDDYQRELFSASHVISGMQYVDLKYQIKACAPISVHRFYFDRALGRYTVSLDFRKKVEFSDVPEGPEFKTDSDYSPLRLWLDGDYSEPVGSALTLIPPSGYLADPTTLAPLEKLGIGDSSANQEFHTLFSPLDPYEAVSVYTYSDQRYITEWTTISGNAGFSGNSNQVHIDYDLGLVSFGDYDPADSSGAGARPASGCNIVIHYTKGVIAEYEPEWGRDYLLAANANVNPVAASTNRGFVQVGIRPNDPDSILLTADLPGTSNPSYLINLGNNIGHLTATVYSARGDVVEGINVTFEVMTPEIGSFGGSASSISAITDGEGEAKAIYNSPLTVEDVGQSATTVTHSGLDTWMEVDGLIDPGSVSGLNIYRVHKEDEALGIPASDENSYYTQYLVDENVVSGDTANITWEENFRTRHNLGMPETYEATDLITGKKTILVTTSREAVIDPDTGTRNPSSPYPFAPLYPSSTEEIGTTANPRLRMVYSNVTLTLPGVGDTKSYFIVGDAKTNVRAYVVHPRTGRRIYSNTIGMTVTIPDTANGTYYAEQLSDIPSGLLQVVRDVDLISDVAINATSGEDSMYDYYLDERLLTSGVYETYTDWFRRTRRGDTVGLAELGFAMPYITVAGLDLPAEIPLGFRLKSTGITLASVLDQVTYISPNSNLASGYYEDYYS